MSASSPPSAAPALRRLIAAVPWLAVLVVVVAVAAAWPLLSEPGFLNTRGGGDSPFLLQRLQQLEVAVRDGHFPARWMPDANYGLGYPFYNFYAPLSIYIALGFRFLGSSYVHALELAQVAGFVLAAWGIYRLALRWYRHSWAAFLAAVAYTMAPFHMVNIYVRGDSLAEFWAMALYPWVILTADRLFGARGPGFPYGRVLAFALAFAALILSHNISALIFTPFLLLFVLLRWLAWMRVGEGTAVAGQASLLGSILAAGLLALALAAWFFVPALAERDVAQLGPVTAGYFSYENHFRGADLVQTGLLFDYDVAGGDAFSMGLVQAVAAALGALTLLFTAWRQRAVAWVPALFILISLVVSTFMITPLSEFLWARLPLLSFTQFPWRFLSVQAFAAALAIGALALLPFCRVVSLGTAVLLLISGLGGLRTDQLLLQDSDISAERLSQYEWFTGNIGSTVSAEYLPPSVQPRIFSSGWVKTGARDEAQALSGVLLGAELQERRAQRQTWQLEAGAEGAQVMLPTLAWPGWHVTVDETVQPLGVAPGSGQIMVALPPGSHMVVLQLERTAVRGAAELVSLLGLLLAFYLLYRARREIRPSPFTAGMALLLLALALFLRLQPATALTEDTLTWDFAQMGYLHHDQAGVPFNNGVRLLRYSYDRESVNAGETLVVTLQFSAANQDTVTLALGTPALARPDVNPPAAPLAEARQVLDQETLQLYLPIPENAPAGLMVPRLTFAVGRPLLPSGGTRGDLFLRPLRVANEQPAEAAPAADLDVQATAVTFRAPDVLDVQLAWFAGRPLSHNYKASLLLLDGAGNWVAQLDAQPGYGFLPSSAWPPGTAVYDWLAMRLPPTSVEPQTLGLVARLYEAESGAVVLTRRLGEVTWGGGQAAFQQNQPSFDLPEGIMPQTAVFEEAIRLRGYTRQREGDTLQVTLYWESLAPLTAEATRFVHVYDPQSEAILAQVDGFPRQNSYPPGQWQPGEIVSDSVTLDLAGIAPDGYEVGVGFYRQDGANFTRLPATDGVSGARILVDRVTLTVQDGR